MPIGFTAAHIHALNGGGSLMHIGDGCKFHITDIRRRYLLNDVCK